MLDRFVEISDIADTVCAGAVAIASTQDEGHFLTLVPMIGKRLARSDLDEAKITLCIAGKRNRHMPDARRNPRPHGSLSRSVPSAS